MASHRRFARFAGLGLAGLISLQVFAYDHPLSSDEIRDAYFLGTDSARSAQVLAPYIKTFSPSPTAGEYVTQIEVRTPYTQLVRYSRQHSNGYSAQQAEEDYTKNGDTVQVRVQILYSLTQALPLQPPPPCAGAQHMNDVLACFPDFDFRLTQDKQLHPAKTDGTAIYSLSDGTIFIGGDVWFTFPAKEVASAPLRVTVTNSKGQKVSTSFDLAALRSIQSL